MTTMTMVEAIRDGLRQTMQADERVMLMGQDVGVLGGVFRASQGLQEEFGADRVVDTPLAEAGIVGTAIGLAVSGLRPVAEIQFLGFTHQAFHQIADQVARFGDRTQGRHRAPVTIRAPFGGGVGTPELHSDAIEAQFVQCPGLKIAMPATAADAKGMLTTAITSEDPVLFCEPLRGYRLVKDDVPEGWHEVPFGKVRVAAEGSDLTIVAWSAAVHLATRAAEALAEEGISARVIDLRTLVPLDVDGLVEHVVATGRCLVVHEAALTGGFGAEVVATVQEEAFYDLEAPIARVASPDTPYPIAALQNFYIPSLDRVVRAARKVVQAS